MKKILSFLAAAAMISMAWSCTKTAETDDPEPTPDPTPAATTITEITATLDGAGIKTAWADGDAILVYAVTDDGDLSAKYVLSAGAGTTNGTFKVEGDGLASGASAYYGCYPYSDIVFAQHNTFSFTLEGEQTAANPIFGKTTDGKAYTFSSPFAGLEIKLTGKGNAGKLYIEDKNADNIINGNVEYNAMTGKTKIKNSSSSKNTVAKTFESTALGDDAVSFFMEVPAGTLDSGASLTVYNPANGMIGLVDIPAQDLAAGSLTTIGPLSLEAVSSVADLSADESANCYMITEPGTYKFRTVRGNEPSSVGSVASAEILWESYCDSTEVTPNSVIASVSYENDYITFKTPDPLKRGNALIAAKDADGVILWSWHIWVVADMVVTGTTMGYEGSAEMMNYNLGALGEPGTVQAYGLLYAWGRKDPFLNAGVLGGETPASVSGIAVTNNVESTADAAKVTEEYATQNPTVWIIVTGSDGMKDWIDVSDDTRWGTTKGIHDPCPAGWRVPAREDNGMFTDNTFTKNDEGTILYFNKEYTLPAPRYKDYTDGHLSSDTKYFTCEGSGEYAYAFRVSKSACEKRRKVEGCSVRCVKITEVEE